METMLNWLSLFISSTAFTGFIPWAFGRRGKGGGTMGALVGCAVLYALLSWDADGAGILVHFGVFLTFSLGLVTVGRAEEFMLHKWDAGRRHTGELVITDRNETNIDEVHGMFWAALPVWLFKSFLAAWPVYLALAFVLFRYFDVQKPTPIWQIERRFKGSPFGVMIDDTAAGLCAAFWLTIIGFALSLGNA